jgi:hypothetical protein
VAWIDLNEGPRLLSNVIGGAVDEVKIGMPVAVVFEQASPEIWLPNSNHQRRKFERASKILGPHHSFQILY